jgi:hypothetical protein
MSQQLRLEISNEIYKVLQQQASASGLSVSEWLIASLKERYGALISPALSSEVEKEARQRLLTYAGAISLGYATGVENEDIDADLAKAYANEF